MNIEVTRTTSGIVSKDCTNEYIVSVSPNLTVEAFINYILSNFPLEWGDIKLYHRYENSIIQYKCGILLNEIKHKDSIIKYVEARGGYSCMNYVITV